MRTRAAIGALLAALTPVPATLAVALPVHAAPPGVSAPDVAAAAPAAPAAPATAPASAASLHVPAGTSAGRTGRVIARITIPRIRLGNRPVREGVSHRVLARGIGHYPGTALPGRIGNTVLLGHRTTYLAPFHHLDRLRRGDRIIVRAGRARHVYRAYATRIISPRTSSVLAPVPFRKGRALRHAVLTLISCHPKGSDRRRIVVLARKEDPPRPAPKPAPSRPPLPPPAPPAANVPRDGERDDDCCDDLRDDHSDGFRHDLRDDIEDGAS